MDHCVSRGCVEFNTPPKWQLECADNLWFTITQLDEDLGGDAQV
jgi:hypothetical protein